MIKRNGITFKDTHEYNQFISNEMSLLVLNTERLYNMVLDGKTNMLYIETLKELKKINSYKIYETEKLEDMVIGELHNYIIPLIKAK